MAWKVRYKGGGKFRYLGDAVGVVYGIDRLTGHLFVKFAKHTHPLRILPKDLVDAEHTSKA